MLLIFNGMSLIVHIEKYGQKVVWGIMYARRLYTKQSRSQNRNLYCQNLAVLLAIRDLNTSLM